MLAPRARRGGRRCTWRTAAGGGGSGTRPRLGAWSARWLSLAAGSGEHGGAAGDAAGGAVDGTIDGEAAQHAKEVAEIGELVGKIESRLRELEG